MSKRIETIEKIYGLVNSRDIQGITALVGYELLRKRVLWNFTRIVANEPDIRFVATKLVETGSDVTFTLSLEGTRRAYEPALQKARFKGSDLLDIRTVLMVDGSSNSTAYGQHHVLSPLAVSLFAKIAPLPGFFTIDDCAHFTLVLRTQTACGMRGDVLEIGSYYGRSTAALAASMNPNETLIACDLFDLEGSDVDYSLTGFGPPSEDGLRRLIASVCEPDRAPKLETHRCFSSEIPLDGTRRFRFIHIDGGHDEDVAIGDLRFSAERLLPGGIIVVDDYAHILYPGVTAAVDRFLSEHPEFYVMGDMNRIAEAGRKQYLCLRA